MAPFDSVCSEYLVSVPSDRYNGTIGVIFSDDFVTKNLGNRGLWELYCNGILPHVAVQTSPYQNRVDVEDYSPSTSHCTVRTGLVYGATYI